MTLLETPRLRLRNLCPGDLEELCDYRNNEACRRYQRGQFREREELRAFIQRCGQDTLDTPGKKRFAIADRHSDRLVGDLFLDLETPTLSLGYTISYKYHRQGYAFELLSALTDRLHADYPDREIVCCVEPENAASIGLLHKLGFADEGYCAPIASLVFSKWAVKEPSTGR